MATIVIQERAQRLLAASIPALYILLLAWLLIGPLWGQPGLPDSADGNLHLHRSAAMARSWSVGEFWPRWFPDVYQGLGAPTFHYYSPLFYLLVGPLHLVGLSLTLSAKLVITAFFLASGLATWAWLRRLMGSVAGLAGATLYLCQAHLFREYYFQGDYPQLLALFLLPILLWAFTELYLSARWPGKVFAPLCLVLLIFSHNITAMMGAVVLALYSLMLLLWKRDGKSWLRVVVGAAWGLGLSAFFWLPALADTGLVQVQNLQEGFFHFAQYFVSWHDLLAAPPLFDGRAANPPFPHLLGWAAWLILAAGLAVVLLGLVRRSRRRDSWFWAIMGLALVALSLALTQPLSTWLWEKLPLLALVEFPSRWLGPAALGLALVAGAVVTAWSERWSWLLLLVLILVVVLGSSVFLFPHQPFRSIDAYTAANTRTYERRSNAWGLTSGDEFLPRWAAEPQAQAGKLARDLYLPPDTEWVWETPHRVALRPAAGSSLPPGAYTLPIHYFPAWGAKAETGSLPLDPGEAGLARVSLASPAAEVGLSWQSTTWQRVGEWLSVLSLLGWAFWLSLSFRNGMPEASPASNEPERSWLQMISPLILIIVLIVGRGIIRVSGVDWFQLSSPPDRVSHVAHPLDVELGGDGQPAVTLLGWEQLAGSDRPGSQVRLRLYWQSVDKTDADLHSIAFLYSPSLQRSWAGVQNHNPGRIPTSNWSRKLYYVDDLVLPLPIDLVPATYTLAVGMVDPQGQRLAVDQNPDDLVLLDEITVQPLRASSRQLVLPEVEAPAAVGSDLMLQGYDLLPDPGGPILRLYWQVLSPLATDLMTFVHFYDEDNQLAAQYDGPPLEGLLLASDWQAGSLLVDTRKVGLPDDLAGGQYTFLVGLYDPSTGTRLPILPEAGSEDHFANDGLVVPLYVPPQ